MQPQMMPGMPMMPGMNYPFNPMVNGENMYNPNNMNPGNMNMPNQNIDLNSMENRISKLERLTKRLDARISRLENPYPTPLSYQSNNDTTNYDNSLKMI